MSATMQARTVDVEGEKRQVTERALDNGGHYFTFTRQECCDGCGGEGVVDFMERGGYTSASLEPRWRTGTCDDCGGNRVVTVDVECTAEGVEL